MTTSKTDISALVEEKLLAGWRLRWYTIIFEADTRAGRRFDQLLIFIILRSVGVIIADSVSVVHLRHGQALTVWE